MVDAQLSTEGLQRARTEGDVLRVEDLHVSFPSASGTVRAVDGMNLTVHPGESVALVGESGCGKTMTALAVLGLLPEQAEMSGRITFEGTDLEDLSRRQIRQVRGAGISMIFQEPVSSLNPTFTISDQIAMVIRAHDGQASKRQARDRALDLLERVGIPDASQRMDEHPHQWSGGMCQRAMIAMAIANRPRLLIADEPTTALDVTVQALVLDVLREARRATEAALVMITHDLGVVAEVADRVVMMYAGRAVETAEVDELFANPRHPYTRGLLASVPRLDRTDRLVSIPGQPPQLHRVPSGCAFHPRCGLGEGRQDCVSEVPALDPSGVGGGTCACHHHRQLEPWDPGQRGPSLPGRRKRSDAALDAGTAPVLELGAVDLHFPIRSSVLGRRIGDLRAVDGVSIDLFAGETVALVGESGCGKTTTANAILRLLDLTGGTIRFQGQDLASMRGRSLQQLRKGIQMVFQDPKASLNPKLTVGTSIAEPLRIHGTSREDAQRRVRELLGLVGLEPGHAARYPHQFSGGQLQRVAIARALALEPRVLVLDEPVSALDVSIQAQILELLADLQDDLGIAYLVISHDLSVVRHVADRVAVMYLGRIVESGPTDSVFDAPRHPYTRALLDAVPVPDPTRRHRRSRIVLTAEMPSPVDPPSGCHFRTRCWKAGEVCSRQVPSLVPGDGGDHPVACHFPVTPTDVPAG